MVQVLAHRMLEIVPRSGKLTEAAAREQDPAILEQLRQRRDEAAIGHRRWHSTHLMPRRKNPSCFLPKGLMKMSESARGILWQDSQQGSYHDATRKRLIAPQLQFTVSKVVVGSCSKT